MVEKLKADVTKLLNNDDFTYVVSGMMFNGEPIHSSYNDRDSPATRLATELSNTGITESLVEHHGGEGEGEQYWAVWSFARGSEKVFVQLNGSYYSYNGPEYDSWYFVEPEEYVAVRYKKI